MPPSRWSSRFGARVAVLMSVAVLAGCAQPVTRSADPRIQRFQTREICQYLRPHGMSGTDCELRVSGNHLLVEDLAGKHATFVVSLDGRVRKHSRPDGPVFVSATGELVQPEDRQPADWWLHDETGRVAVRRRDREERADVFDVGPPLVRLFSLDYRETFCPSDAFVLSDGVYVVWYPDMWRDLSEGEFNCLRFSRDEQGKWVPGERYRIEGVVEAADPNSRRIVVTRAAQKPWPWPAEQSLVDLATGRRHRLGRYSGDVLVFSDERGLSEAIELSREQRQ